MFLKRFLFAGAIGLLADPKVLAQSRGSSEEKAAFEKHQIGADKNLSAPTASNGIEVRDSLLPGERPALRHLKQKKGGLTTHETTQPLPSKINHLENTGISSPSEFEAEYNLDQDAEVAVSILGPNGVVVREFRIKPGAPGGQAGRNSLSLWDGRDLTGREAEPGPYQALLTVLTGNQDPGKRSKIIILRKKS